MQASADMVALYNLLPAKARLVLQASDTTVEVPADVVSKGDLIRVLPGDRLPVDGVVVSGCTTVDEAALTGEPMPVVKEKGHLVTAGTVNVDGALASVLLPEFFALKFPNRILQFEFCCLNSPA
jgi:P-type Cu+ transporter